MTAKQEVNVDGITVTLGPKSARRDLVVPPLNFKALKKLQSRLATYKEGVFDDATMELAVDVAVAALGRNYEAVDISREFIEEWLDVGNMQEFMEAAMDVSGLKRKAVEQAGRSSDPLTGTASTVS